VLVVEDMPYNARALGIILADMGFEVEFAGDGPEALDRMNRGSYRVVFLDCDLPRLGGVEVARRFREGEDPALRTLIVATTADSGTEGAALCAAAGIDGRITKPITPAAVESFLATKGLVSPAGTHAPGPTERPSDGGPDLSLVLMPAGKSPVARSRELGRYIEALEDALGSADRARTLRERAGVASAAHRVLSLARIVGAEGLAGRAADIQEFCAVYTEEELTSELAELRGQAADLKSALAEAARAEGITPAWAS